MKKLIYFLSVVVLSTGLHAQNEELHDAKIIGSFELGSKEVTTIYDEVTGCERKTSPHTKHLFTPNESVQVKIVGNKQMAEVIKPYLPEKVYTNKNCGSDQQNCATALCILKNNESSLQIKYTDGNYKVFYNASKKPNNSIKSNLIVYGGNNGNGAIPTKYFLDKSEQDKYKLISYRGVLEGANILANHSGLEISDADEAILEKLILEIKANEGNLMQSELAQSIYFNVAIIKSTKRAKENGSNDCNCAPVPMYFTGQSPFVCQEDVSYDVNGILEDLEENLSEISQKYDTETINQLRTYLESSSKKSITFEEMNLSLLNGVATNLFINDIEDFIETRRCFLLGTDPGCCGNYAGCCWYGSMTCLMHDLHCWRCQYVIYCLPGCVPG
jgi:hypothetical protein